MTIQDIIEREVANASPRFRFIHANNTPSDIARDLGLAVARAVVEEIVALGDGLKERATAVDTRIIHRTMGIATYQDAIRALAAQGPGGEETDA